MGSFLSNKISFIRKDIENIGLNLSLQSYLAPIKEFIAIITGPALYDPLFLHQL